VIENGVNENEIHMSVTYLEQGWVQRQTRNVYARAAMNMSKREKMTHLSVPYCFDSRSISVRLCCSTLSL